MRGKWRSISTTPNSVTFGKEEFHTWQIVLSIITFPLGLLALAAEKQKLWVNATAVENGSGAVIVVSGPIPGQSQIEPMLDYVEAQIDSDSPPA